VVATVSLGTFIVAEATLSFLGIGLPSNIMSWGNDIGQARTSIRTSPQVLIYPSIALSITVLSFLMLGDVVRDALDPKARARG
jgi:oligopeptide transport system permease protein